MRRASGEIEMRKESLGERILRGLKRAPILTNRGNETSSQRTCRNLRGTVAPNEPSKPDSELSFRLERLINPQRIEASKGDANDVNGLIKQDVGVRLASKERCHVFLQPAFELDYSTPFE